MMRDQKVIFAICIKRQVAVEDTQEKRERQGREDPRRDTLHFTLDAA